MIATGPYRGNRFRISRQPFLGLLFRELDTGNWPTVYVTGPSQSSKTLSGFVIPTLRDACELREDIIVGCPEADMADDKWHRDFLPTLESSPALRSLIPTKGPGSRGGSVRDRITLGNGVSLKIMTCGGSDTAVAGYTSPRIRITEAAGWSRNKDGTVEADRIRQIAARMRAFHIRDRSIIVEGTVTVAEQLPWRARGDDDDDMLISTQSMILSPCPHCGEWISPEREHLVGWQDAKSEQEAIDNAVFVCTKCGEPISDQQRRTAMSDCRLVHHGQSIDRDGVVTGHKPPTSTLWFRWAAYHNLLLDAADTAIDEWRASQIEDGTVDRENAERELCQFCHSIPYKNRLDEIEPLNAKVIRKRRGEYPRGTLPADTEKLTVGVDIGKYTGYWFAIAWTTSGRLHVPAYGAFDIMRNPSDDLATRIVLALRELRENLEDGYHIAESDQMMVPDSVWIDIGYRPDDVAVFIRESGGVRDNRYRAARGRGRSTNRGAYSQPTSVSRKRIRIGRNWFADVNYDRKIFEFTFDSDYWKLYVHDRLRAKVGSSKGAMAFYRADTKNEHAKLSHHLASEQFIRTTDKNGRPVEKWVKSGENHWLDCAAMACAAGDYVGYDLLKISDIEVVEVATAVENGDSKEICNWYSEIATK